MPRAKQRAGQSRIRRDRQFVQAAYERFLAGDVLPSGLDPLVTASWRRSRETGINPDDPSVSIGMADDDLTAYREQHRLAQAMPVIRDLIVPGAADGGLIVAVTDAVGRTMWVEGSTPARHLAENVGFVEGALWGEAQMGTNAPALALAEGAPVQVIGAEHFIRPVQSLSCAAVPIRDLTNGQVLGVLDVTGGESAATPVALAMVRAAAATVERELANFHLVRLSHLAEPELTLLGTPQIRTDAGNQQLALRHAEILALLIDRPQGLTSAELAVLLHHDGLSEVAVRAEVSRLRRVAGHLLADGRPYRLRRVVSTDLSTVRGALATGTVRDAVAAYRAPLLPRSVAPGIEDQRESLAAEVRQAVLASGDPDVLEAWTRTAEGGQDYEVWAALRGAAPPGSPAWIRAEAHRTVLDAALR